MKFKCPICKKTVLSDEKIDGKKSPWLPFCSQRCKLIDLGRWLDSDYRIPAKEEDDEKN